MMRVAEKTQNGAGIQQSFQGLRRREDVLVFILKSAVDKHHSVRRVRGPAGSAASHAISSAEKLRCVQSTAIWRPD